MPQPSPPGGKNRKKPPLVVVALLPEPEETPEFAEIPEDAFFAVAEWVPVLVLVCAAVAAVLAWTACRKWELVMAHRGAGA